jgi:hypothetical protein
MAINAVAETATKICAMELAEPMAKLIAYNMTLSSFCLV